MHILVDSTGIKVTGDGEWVRKKHGVNQHRQWLKLHLATDANSGEIQAVEVTTCQYGDAEMLQPLLDQIDEPIASVTADGAYDTVNCYDAILKRQANVIIPPRSNALLYGQKMKLVKQGIMQYKAVGTRVKSSGNEILVIIDDPE